MGDLFNPHVTTPPPLPAAPPTEDQADTEVKAEELTSRRRLRGSTLVSAGQGGGNTQQATVGSTLIGS